MPPQRRGAWLDHRRLFLSPMMELRREEEPALVVHYSVVARPSSGVFLTRREQDVAPYLQLPEGLDPRFRSLARRAASGAGPEDPIRAAEAVARTLRSEYRYTLDLRGTSDERPLEDFLFRTRAGHCEFFSTAMTLLLRAQGIPARNVTGFLGGRRNRFGMDGAFYTVAQSDAHSWVEVYVDGLGWVAYDPTPAGRAEAGSSSRASASSPSWSTRAASPGRRTSSPTTSTPRSSSSARPGGRAGASGGALPAVRPGGEAQAAAALPLGRDRPRPRGRHGRRPALVAPHAGPARVPVAAARPAGPRPRRGPRRSSRASTGPSPARARPVPRAGPRPSTWPASSSSATPLPSPRAWWSAATTRPASASPRSTTPSSPASRASSGRQRSGPGSSGARPGGQTSAESPGSLFWQLARPRGLPGGGSPC